MQDTEPELSTPTGRRRPRKKSAAVLALAVVLAAGAGTTALVRTAPAAVSQPEAATGPVTVIVQRARFEPASQPRSFVAVVRPRVEAPLAFRVAGRVESRLVGIGDRVTAGQELARLARDDFALMLRQAQYEVTAAEEAYAAAAEDERRITALQTSGVASNAAKDAALSAAQEARARLERGRAQMDLARNTLDYTTLRADTDGVIVALSLEAGQVVSAGQTVLRIARAGEVEAEVSFPETYAPPATGTTARFVPWAMQDQSFAASLREVSPYADAATHNFAARFSLTGADATAGLAGLKFGMTGRLEIAPAQDKPQLRVPVTALYDPGTGPGLWRMEGASSLAFVPVQVDALDGTHARIRASIRQDDLIVTLGASRLSAGQSVQPLERAYE